MQARNRAFHTLLAVLLCVMASAATAQTSEVEYRATGRGATLEAYDVYAFDGCLPEKLPQDGAVWLLNPPRSPREVGVVLGERLMGAYVKGARTDTELGERLTRGLVGQKEREPEVLPPEALTEGLTDLEARVSQLERRPSPGESKPKLIVAE